MYGWVWLYRCAQGGSHRLPRSGRGVPWEMTGDCACIGQCSMSQHAGPTVVAGIET